MGCGQRWLHLQRSVRFGGQRLCGRPAREGQLRYFHELQSRIESARGLRRGRLCLLTRRRADSGSPSYEQGKQAIDDQVLNRHVQLTPSTDLYQYCDILRGNVLKSGLMARVDSPSDFIAGCQDEGRELIASQ